MYLGPIFTKQERKQSFAPIDFNAEPHNQVPFAMTAARSKYGKPASSVYMVKSHEMDSLWGSVRNSGGHIFILFLKVFVIDG